MYKMNKKGLSDVITTVLIILLVLAAVVLIWSFIRKPLVQSGETVDLRTQCLQKSVEVVSCKITTASTTTTDGSATVTYRNTGDAAYKVTTIVTYVDGTTVSATDATPATSDSIVVTIAAGKTPSKAIGTAVIQKDDGSDYTCDPTLTEVTCTA